MSDKTVDAKDRFKVGDTVWTGGRWYLWGEPRAYSGTVLKVAPSGRLATDCPNVYTKNYTDTLYFGTREEVMANYRALADAEIKSLRERIHAMESFQGQCK